MSAARASMLAQAGRIALKELRTSLRDRQTVLYTLVLPICLYPIVFWIMVQGLLVVQGRRELMSATVGIVAPSEAALPAGLAAALARPPEVSAEEPADLDLEARYAAEVEQAARAWMAVEPEEERPAAVIALPPAGSEAPATLFHDSSESRSELARERARARLARFAGEQRAQAARARHLDPAELDPLELASHDIAPREDRGRVLLATLLPMLLVVMTFMGAFFPAVDLTAGEKERGTLETTWILPVPRSSVHLGKILAVTLMAVVATGLNLVALALAADALLAPFRRMVDVQVDLPIGALVGVAPLAVLFACFVSSMLVAAASLARSFKEGQAMLGPVQMLFIVPGIAGMLPGLSLTPGLACVPVLGVVLAFKALLLGESRPLAFAACALSLVLFAVLGVCFAARLMSREAVALAGESHSLGRVLRLLRSEGSGR